MDNYIGKYELPTIDYAQHIRNYRHLEDQLEKTRNDLSHEAQYKLSKNEQENVSISTRRKRSTNILAKGRDIQDQPNDDDDDQDIDYDQDSEYDEAEIEDNILKEISHTPNCSTDLENLTTKPQNNTNSTDIHRNQTEHATGNEPKNRLGITVEVKINNVTKNRIQTIEDLRRRKKDLTYRRRTRNKQ